MAIPDPGRSLIVEFIGAFALTFAGVAAIAVSGGNLVSVGLAHGLAIGLMVVAVGHISGGHYNPAITVGMYLAGKIDAVKGALYIIAQLLGAVVAALLLKYVLDDIPVPQGANISDWVQAGTPALNAGPACDERPGPFSITVTSVRPARRDGPQRRG